MSDAVCAIGGRRRLGDCSDAGVCVDLNGPFTGRLEGLSKTTIEVLILGGIDLAFEYKVRRNDGEVFGMFCWGCSNVLPDRSSRAFPVGWVSEAGATSGHDEQGAHSDDDATPLDLDAADPLRVQR